MNRGFFLTGLAVLLALASLLSADEWKPRHGLVSHTGIWNLPEPPQPGEVFLAGPENPSEQPAWLDGLKAWRNERQTLLRYSPSQYERTELEWTQHVFSQVQLLIWDRSLYDPEKLDYTVDRFLSETERRIGAIDAVLIWHVYPNLGVDDRNQFDLLRDLPGGIGRPAAHGRAISQARRKSVFSVSRLGYLHPGRGRPSLDNHGSTDEGDWRRRNQFRHLGERSSAIPASVGCARTPLALEPQFQPRDESLAWTNISWNDWVTWEGKPYPFVPMVSKNKWLETRHTVNITDRFTRDKTDSLQHSFFNGQGYASLENLWGFWYPSTPHDSEAILRITRIERAMAPFLRSPDWEPHTAVVQAGVFASRFPGAGGTLWTIVNRNEYNVSGPQLVVPHQSGLHYYDLWQGTQLTPSLANDKATLSFELESLGFGAVFATEKSPASSELQNLLQFMAERSRRPLASYPREWKPVPQTLVEIPVTKPLQSVPGGMVRIPAGDFDFQVSGIEVEGGNDPGVDVQYPWEDAPRREHRHSMHIHEFYLDRTPVTNAEFKKFLEATRISTEGRSQLPACLEGRYLSRRLGEQARNLGVHRRRSRLCCLVW